MRTPHATVGPICLAALLLLPPARAGDAAEAGETATIDATEAAAPVTVVKDRAALIYYVPGGDERVVVDSAPEANGIHIAFYHPGPWATGGPPTRPCFRVAAVSVEELSQLRDAGETLETVPVEDIRVRYQVFPPVDGHPVVARRIGQTGVYGLDPRMEEWFASNVDWQSHGPPVSECDVPYAPVATHPTPSRDGGASTPTTGRSA